MPFALLAGPSWPPALSTLECQLDFRVMVGDGDLATAVLALLALIALRAKLSGAIALVWLCVVVGMLDTVNAIIQSTRYSVFTYPLGVNWAIVTMHVPAPLVSSLLIFMQLLRPTRPSTESSPRS